MKTQIAKSQTLKSVNQTAWKLVKTAGKTWSEAIKTAWQFVKNQTKVAKAFLASFFEITFVKANGEITTRKASNPKKADNDTNLLFFSVSDNGFRKATIANIIDIVPIENVTLALV